HFGDVGQDEVSGERTHRQLEFAQQARSDHIEVGSSTVLSTVDSRATSAAGIVRRRCGPAGEALFAGKARCASCHVPPLFTEPGWNTHKASEIGIDDFQANRTPDRSHSTAPLKGLWTYDNANGHGERLGQDTITTVDSRT